MYVQVYWNWHKNMFSIRAKEGANKGKVVAHAYDVLLDTVTFRVSESGRERVVFDKRKNVHAYVEGHLMNMNGEPYLNRLPMIPGAQWWTMNESRSAAAIKEQGAFVRYNPYIAGYFFTEVGQTGSQRRINMHDASRAYLSAEDGKPAIYTLGSTQLGIAA